MDKTLDRLESMFNKADADLDYMSRKLDTEFETELAEADTPLKENPKKVLEKLGGIKKEYAAIAQETKAIQDAQQEAMKFFGSQISTLCDTLVKLEMNIGRESEITPEQNALESLLGLAITAQSECPSAEVTQPLNSAVDQLGATGEPTQDIISDNTSYQSKNVLSAYECRQGLSECMDLLEDEFASVPASTRGRLKLAEVNQVYRILWHHYEEDPSDHSLNAADMFKLGLRVTGHSGEAKLKVLQHLKLISISRARQVKLL